MTIILILFTITVPFLVSAFVNHTVLAACTAALAVQAYIMMNEIANDVEDPFHYDPNQLPLPQMQYRLNERLLAVAQTHRPLAFTDVGGLQGPEHFPRPDGVCVVVSFYSKRDNAFV
jgi:predicted membrane chloride channel (bestrophin family)